MSAPKRFDKGVSNVASTSSMAQFGAMDKSLYHEYFNDFNIYTATDWVITTTEAGAGSATEALADETNGVLLLTNAAGDNDLDFLQLSKDGGTTPAETFLFATGKKAWFKTKIKSNDVDQVDIVIGLHITDTDPVGGVSDGVFFRSLDESSDISIVSEKDSVESSAVVATMVDATYVTLGFYWDGVDTITYFADDVEIGTLTPGTNLPDDEELAVSFGVQNGEAVANNLSVDYIWAAMER